MIVVSQRYSEGLMDSVSMGIGTGTIGTALSKPVGDWGFDGWAEPAATDDSDWGRF